MGREWDEDKGGTEDWVAWLAEIAREVHRVLKPGAHGLVWALPRTSHWTGAALERAGFEIRDQIHHVFGSGFPKSLDVSKAIDAAAGAERPVVGTQVLSGTAALSIEEKGGTYSSGISSDGAKKTIEITAPATDAAKEWSGYGTALKPAHEVWWLVRKPLDGTVAANVQEHGTGALNIDGCRVGTSKNVPHSASTKNLADLECGWGLKAKEDVGGRDPNLGRWPANFVLTHSAACKKVGTAEVRANPTWDTPNRETESTFTGETVSKVRHGDGETETVDVFECAPDCPVRLLDEQSGDSSASFRTSRNHQGGEFGWTAGNSPGHADSGGASRFFHCFELTELDDLTPFLYMAKPSRSERDKGLEHWETVAGGEAAGRAEGSAGTKSPRAGAGRNGGARNVHPTVKGVDFMRFLCRLITPPGGIVLDQTAGSGSTGVAALLEGFRFLGIELNDTHEEPFVSIARARLQHVMGGAIAMPETAPLRPKKDVKQRSLFE
jgi:site-specific DNA-methyltransferase (adenine-specific)